MKKTFVICLTVLITISTVAGCSSDNQTNQTIQTIQGTLKSAQIGGYITLGEYEQDNNISNGKEAIEWLVLAKESERILIISKHLLDSVQFTKTASFEWENSNIRKWLNNDFMQTAFTVEERELIEESVVPADNHPNFAQDPNKYTVDNVFLLGISEVNQHFKTSEDAICTATKYAESQSQSWLPTYYCWMLRSYGKSLSHIAFVEPDGIINEDGSIISYDHETNTVSSSGYIRPAMWISIT